MSFLKALDILFKVKDIKDAVDEAKKLSDYAKKLESLPPGKVRWDNLKYFNDKTMDDATAQLRKTETKLDSALRDTLEWPTSDSMSAFMDALKAADKYGENSKEAKKALNKYRLALLKYHLALVMVVSDLQDAEKSIPKRTQTAKSLASYSSTLEDNFLKLAQIPSLLGTTQNAMFFSLSVDAGQLSGIARSVAEKLDKLDAKNDAYIRECNDLIKQNRAWIDWATNGATAEGSMKKNQSNDKKPK